MSDKDPLVALLGRVHEHLVGLSAAVQELAAQIEGQQPSRVRNLLTEEQMAEYLGITKKALSGRRYRKDFPEEACEKFGGSWLYSVKATKSGGKGCGCKPRLLGRLPVSAYQNPPCREALGRFTALFDGHSVTMPREGCVKVWAHLRRLAGAACRGSSSICRTIRR